MSVSRDDIPHLLNATRAPRPAWHVARLLVRYAMDRMRYARGTRITNGNALVARLAKSLFERDVPLWVSSPVVQLLVEDDAVRGALVERAGKRLELRCRRGVVLASGGFPRNERNNFV